MTSDSITSWLQVPQRLPTILRKRYLAPLYLQGFGEVTAVHLPVSPLIPPFPSPGTCCLYSFHALILYLYLSLPISSPGLRFNTITSRTAFPKPASEGIKCSSTAFSGILYPHQTPSHHSTYVIIVLSWLSLRLGWKFLEVSSMSELPLYSPPTKSVV